MNKNMGLTDKIIRIVIGFMLLLAGFMLPTSAAVQVALFVVASIAFATALFSFCPIYRLIGLSTRKEQ